MDFLTFADSAEYDEMQHNAAFHLGSSLFAKVLTYGLPEYKGLVSWVRSGT